MDIIPFFSSSVTAIAPPIAAPPTPMGTMGSGAFSRASAVHVAVSLAVGSSLEVAITVIVVDSPSVASLGTVTLTVVVPSSPAGTVSRSSESSAPPARVVAHG